MKERRTAPLSRVPVIEFRTNGDLLGAEMYDSDGPGVNTLLARGPDMADRESALSELERVVCLQHSERMAAIQKAKETTWKTV